MSSHLRGRLLSELTVAPRHRIAIVGAAETGKTYLADRIARSTGVNRVSLDALRWPNYPDGVAATDAQFAQALRRATEGDDWVMEGTEASPAVIEAWYRAEVVVWLDHTSVDVVRRLYPGTAAFLRAPFDRSRPAWLGRGGRASYFVRKATMSLRQRVVQRRTLPILLAGLAAAGVDVVVVRSLIENDLVLAVLAPR